MTQCEMILQHLVEHGSITAVEAMEEYGIARLASRVSDLKSDGVPIRRRMVTAKNRFGEPVSYAEYRLEEEEKRD